MIDFLLPDIFALLAPLLGRAQTYNLSFVSRRLREMIGLVTKDDMLSYSMVARNPILFQDYLNRFPFFPLNFSVRLGRTGSLQLINLALKKVNREMLDCFNFHVAQGFLLAGHDQFFKRAPISPVARKQLLLEYFDHWKNIRSSSQLITDYLMLLDQEEIFPARMANVFRAMPEYAKCIPVERYNYADVICAGLEANSLEVILELHQRIPDLASKVPAHLISLSLAKQLFESDNAFTILHIEVIIFYNDLELLAANAHLILDKFKYKLKELTVEGLTAVLSTKKFEGNIFEFLPRQRDYFAVAVQAGYILSKLEFWHVNIGHHIKISVVFQPSITSFDDERLEFFSLKIGSLPFTLFLFQHEGGIRLPYSSVVSKENVELLIRRKKLSAEYCCNNQDYNETSLWIQIWGVEDLNEKACRGIYYYLSKIHSAGAKKRSVSPLRELMSYVHRNKQGFLAAIMGAKRSYFRVDALNTILDEIGDLSSKQKRAIEQLTSEQAMALIPRKKH